MTNGYLSQKNGIGAEYQPAPTAAHDITVTDGPITRRIDVTRKNSPLCRSVVTLYRAATYADLTFDLDLSIPVGENGGANDTSVNYAIGFPIVSSKQLWLDGPGMVFCAPDDILPGGGSPQQTPLHFVHFQKDGQSGITLANRDAFLLRPDRLFLLASVSLLAQTRDEGTERLFRTEPHGSNIQSFRFRIAAQDQDVASWKNLGIELNLPLQASIISATTLPPEQSFFSVSHPNVRITAFKPAEFQHGWHVIRFQEIGGKTAENVRLVTQFRFSEAMIANTVERPTGAKADLSNFHLSPWQTLTVLVRMQR
ncbi:MAG: hypothetical protein J2P21_18505 [Chloracidobacterium sp.]|nr:hypothetical protein [Chloracidobacterium sp.]